jgi:F0F1-type ATP synthase membrane subunit a
LPIDKLVGNILAGAIAVYLIIAALILAVDAYSAFQRFRTQAVPATSKAE